MEAYLMGDKNKRKYWWFWLIWAGIFVAIEGYALATKEKVVPTLSRTIWWLRDRWKWIVITIVVVGGIWGILHLAGGECFAGLC